MLLWKQRLFSRLMEPATEGSDLGGSDAPGTTVTAADSTGAADQPAETTEEPVSEGAEATHAQPGDKTKAFLDGLTEGAAPPKPEAKPAEAPAEVKPPVAEVPKTPEQEEAELLDGVKSERGKERIKSVFAKAKVLETDIGEFRELINSTGMSPQDFAQTLEFGRLMNSGDEKNLRVALEMVEGQRQMLYAKLGVEAPGVDLLTGHDDLKAAVENMEITRDRAVELAKFRKVDGENRQRVQVQQQSLQDQQQFAQTVQQASQAMEGYLDTRKNEVDHLPRMKVLADHFKNPAKMQAFVSTYRPDQWAATVKMMYDNVSVARPAPQTAQQPLRSRPANLGTPSASGSTPMDRIASRMDAMGL